ncbi:MAG: LytTR family DNA-binding domain-containing protein [Spirosomataceae bacterium]
MKILILEDEPLAAKRLETLVKAIEPQSEILAKLESVRSTIKWLNEHPQPDLILMDIQLADGLSFELFQQVDITAPIIFTTAYDEYAIRAFKVNSVDYLLKPIGKEDLEAALWKFKNQRSATSQDQMGKVLEALLSQKTEWKTRFLLKSGARFDVVEVANVAYLYAEDKVVFLITNEQKKYFVDDTLDEVEQKLNPKNFFRLNRKYITQVASIERIEPHFNGRIKIKLRYREDDDIYVSREKADAFKKWLDT